MFLAINIVPVKSTFKDVTLLFTGLAWLSKIQP